MRNIIVLILSLCPLSVLAVNDSYDCRQVADTSVGWSPSGKRYTADAEDSRKGGLLVKIIDLNTDVPKIVGQSVAKLLSVTRTDNYLTMLEVTPSGTAVTWTLFLASPKLGQPNTILISSKSYDLMGPVNFTTLFECT